MGFIFAPLWLEGKGESRIPIALTDFKTGDSGIIREIKRKGLLYKKGISRV